MLSKLLKNIFPRVSSINIKYLSDNNETRIKKKEKKLNHKMLKIKINIIGINGSLIKLWIHERFMD